jgi:drug/metabolite transporter (DMT)-like permease
VGAGRWEGTEGAVAWKELLLKPWALRRKGKRREERNSSGRSRVLPEFRLGRQAVRVTSDEIRMTWLVAHGLLHVACTFQSFFTGVHVGFLRCLFVPTFSVAQIHGMTTTYPFQVLFVGFLLFHERFQYVATFNFKNSLKNKK